MTVLNIPDYEFENLARDFLPEMRKYFASEKGKAEYEKWLSEQKSEEEKKAA